MPYRSEVVFAIAPQVAGEFKKLMEENQILRELVEGNIHYNRYEEGDIVVYFPSIRWNHEYYKYEPITIIEDFLFGLDDLPRTDSILDSSDLYRWCRIGDDRTDLAESGYYHIDDCTIIDPSMKW